MAKSQHRVTRVTDVLPELLVDELMAVNSVYPKWLDVIAISTTEFRVEFKEGIKFPLLMSTLLADCPGSQAMVLLAASEWLRQGPKIVRPTAEQAESLSHVNVELELRDFAMPFPCLYVETPSNPRFIGVMILRYSDDVQDQNVMSQSNRDDIYVLITQDAGRSIESYLSSVDKELEPLLHHCQAAQRVALNMCLALTNFGCESKPDQPKQLEEDKRWAKEDNERGRKARKRVAFALNRVEFQQHTVIRKSKPRPDAEGESGRLMPTHWVRGHWKMQTYGPKSALRKRILISPYLVNAGEALGPIGAVYEDRR